MTHRFRFIALLLLLISGCTREQVVQKTETIMGTEVTVTVVAPSATTGGAAVDAALAEVKRIDAMMSLYKDASELTKVNHEAGKRPVTVSPEIIEVADLAKWVSERSGGAFDATIGPLVVLWQMKLQEGATPTSGEIAGVRKKVGYQKLVINKDASTIFLTQPGMIMDFGGIAKGYAADRAAAVLRQRGINNALVAIAGDIRAMGRRADGTPWRIGVQHPREHDKTLTVLELSDQSISTSGDYERFTILKNKRYHHILDPRTGRPAEGLESVTIVGGRGAVIDPFTTALFILGAEKGKKTAEDLGFEAIFVDDRGKVTATRGIKLH